jgi:hypothetical protein
MYAQVAGFFKPSDDPTYGIMAVLIGALLAVPSYFYAARKFKIDNAFELQKEFNDTENYRRRHEAWGFMEMKCYVPNKYLDYYRGSAENWSGGQPHISTIYFLLSFFERLWLVIQHERVKRRFVRRVFGRVFFWWYIMYFEDFVLASPDSRGHGYFKYLTDFKKWLEFHTPRTRIDQWEKAAREYKASPGRAIRLCACPQVGCNCPPVL